MSGQPTSPERVEDEDASLVVIGHTVRVERKRRGWSVAGLSERAGVSFGLLSGLERGQGNPSYRALHRIAAALEIPTTKLLTADSATDLVVRAGTGRLLPVDPAAPAHQRVRRELLTPHQQTTLQLIRSTIPPGFSNEHSPFRHLGTEVVTVESGRLLVVHGERRATLEVGDSATYGCSTPHWWANESDGVTVVLGAVTPFEG